MVRCVLEGKYFPFDTQICTQTYRAQDYSAEFLNLYADASVEPGLGSVRANTCTLTHHELSLQIGIITQIDLQIEGSLRPTLTVDPLQTYNQSNGNQS